MDNKNILIALVVIVVLGGGALFLAKSGKNEATPGMGAPTETSQAPEASASAPSTTPSAAVKEFTMTSFFAMENGKPHPQFSLNNIAVKKGDTVRLKITNTKGAHNFNIDEYGIHAETPLDKEVVVEFVADKTGDFVYYCSMPNHRQNGQWGTLTVTE